MTRDDLMEAVRTRAFACRISLYELADETGVSGTIITRWVRGTHTPTLRTIDRFERTLLDIERRREREMAG